MKTFTDPTIFPSVWTLVQTKKDIRLADLATHTAMKMNGRAVDETEMFRRFRASDNPIPVTVEDVKACLKTGAKFREPQVNEPDPTCGPVTCVTWTCRKVFQPIFYKAKNKKTGEEEDRGSFVERKAKDLTVPDAEARAVIVAILEATTMAVLGKKLPNIYVVAKCPDCVRKERTCLPKENRVFMTYLTAAGVREKALGHETVVHAARIQNSVNDSFFAKRKDHGNKPSSNRGEGSRSGGYQRRTVDDRPRGNWHGKSFLKGTAEAFTRAETDGKLTGFEQIASMSDEELRLIGAAYTERAAEVVRSIAKQAKDEADLATRVGKIASVPTHLEDVAKGIENLKNLDLNPAPPKKGRQKKEREGWDRRPRRREQLED